MTHDDDACSRRSMLGAVGLAGAGVLTAGGCSAKPTTATQVPPGIKGKVIAQTSEVPVGGGKLIDKWKILLVQPTKGVFKAFTSTCTHKGCTVGSPENGVIACPCHGSQFDAGDGSVKHGPAVKPLHEYTVRLQGDGITIV